MEQYKSEGTVDVSATKPATIITAETRHIQSIESLVKQLQDTTSIQQNEIAKLRRDITRLKSEISDIITVLKDRG